MGVAEAKQVWLAHTTGRNARKRVQDALTRSFTEVWTAPDGAGRYRRFGLVFVAPWVRKRVVKDPDRLAQSLEGLVDEMKDAHPSAALAWAFPAGKRRLVSKRHTGRYYPGILLLLAPHPR